MAARPPAFDADAHFMEPSDFWVRYIEPEWKERAPVGDEDRHGLTVDGRLRFPTIKWARIGHLNEVWAREYGEFEERGWDAGAYLEGMARHEVDHMALYPSRGLMQVAPWGLDPKLAAAITRAYNRWAADFVSESGGRLLAVGQLDLRDVDEAIAEARRAVADHGFRAFFVLPESPLPGVTLDRPYYDPLWTTLEELDVAVAIHNVAGTGLGQIGAERFGNWATPRIAFAFPLEAQVTLFSFLCGGICERHPDLRVVILESGSGWLPYWLWHLDKLAEEFGDFDLPPLSLSPSDYFRRQCFLSADVDEPMLPQVIDAVGSGCIVTASDFPHPEGSFPHGVQALRERGDLGTDVLDRVLWENPRRLYGFAS
ncbi:MAG: amidohydrolase [Deltaproteobacteria bacterium]|jgi:predicted TIM-barrel fold metal-dependent hydrolase|nr:amidohydrolase [Deltaproteobacteria bacterium]MBW2499322.1 amidohydrolase [Deltaproteobacteria bacterium]